MAEKIFEISIEGQGVAPETIRLRDLFDVLSAFETAVIVTAGQLSADSAEAELHLVGIHKGSTACTVSTAPAGYRAAALCTEAISRRDLSQLPMKARKGLLDVHAKARARKWRICVSDGNGMKPAEIEPDTTFIADATIAGLSSLSGKLDRIGGSASPTANFLMADGRRFTADVANQELAAQLAPLLYRFVSVEGEAKWSSIDLTLLDFKITGISGYDDSADIRETLDELAKISGGFWDSIDPDEYVAGLRSGAD